ncbi:MAG: hypothetical protein CM1200mP40_11400 [Gammaproteobacteria bacterium]|nr:MAG: hypothetical protein CM1200mP40_11400 [Gammaproteobacteria bacterium]
MLDDLGFLVILDRAKDIVIRGGENIGCAEVEYAIAEHPSVSEVSVYGIPDKRLGEILVATVMLKPEEKLIDDDLKISYQKELLPSKFPNSSISSMNNFLESHLEKSLRKSYDNLLWKS